MIGQRRAALLEVGLLVLLVWLIVYPLVLVLVGGVRGADGWTVDFVRQFLERRNEAQALWGSLWISLATVVLAGAIGIPLGFLFSRFRLSSRASDETHRQFGQRALFFARILCQDLIQRKAVFFARKTKNKKEQGKPRNDVAAEVKQRVVQEMAEGDDDEHRAEGDERIAGA